MRGQNIRACWRHSRAPTRKARTRWSPTSCRSPASREAAAELRTIAKDGSLKLDAALDLFESRTGFLAARGVDVRRIKFSTAFGRGLDYYTGFVFELHENAARFFSRAGLELIKPRGARDYRGTIAGLPSIEVAFLSAAEITELLGQGMVHFGVTGEDLVREMIPDADCKVILIDGLGFGYANAEVAV